MRVLQLVEATLAGVGRHVVDLTEGLLDRGHEVHLVYSSLRADQVFFDDVRRLSARPGLRLFALSMRRAPGASDMTVMWKLRQYLRREGPFDLVHCHSTKAGMVGRLATTGFRVKCIYTPHGFFTMDDSNSPVARRIAAGLEAGLSKVGDGVVAISQAENAHALGIGISASRLHLIPNGVAVGQNYVASMGRRSVRQEIGVAANEFVIGFVGRLVPVKSPETMLRAFAAFRRQSRVSAKLVMVGDGPLSGALRSQAADLGVESDVVWAGSRDARSLMDGFDVLCITSNSEGTPLVALEALAHGLPIIATEVGQIPEIVRSGVNGFIAPVRGVAEVAAALDVLARDAELRARMGQASRAQSRNFSLENMIEQTLTYYQQLVYGTGSVNTAPDLKIAASR